MIPNSGQAVLHIAGVGMLHLDPKGMTLLHADSVDLKTHKNLLAQVSRTFKQVDEVHITVREAIDKLPRHFMVPMEAMTVVEISDEEPIEPPTEGKHF